MNRALLLRMPSELYGRLKIESRRHEMSVAEFAKRSLQKSVRVSKDEADLAAIIEAAAGSAPIPLMFPAGTCLEHVQPISDTGRGQKAGHSDGQNEGQVSERPRFQG